MDSSDSHFISPIKFLCIFFTKFTLPWNKFDDSTRILQTFHVLKNSDPPEIKHIFNFVNYFYFLGHSSIVVYYLRNDDDVFFYSAMPNETVKVYTSVFLNIIFRYRFTGKSADFSIDLSKTSLTWHTEIKGLLYEFTRKM